jgi:hypothetical protein
MKSRSRFNSFRIAHASIFSCMMICWFSSARAVVAPDPADTACEQQDTQDALTRLMNAGPDELRDAIKRMDSSTTFTCSIRKNPLGYYHTSPAPNGAVIDWDENPRNQKYFDHICVNADAALAHELWHCFQHFTRTVEKKEKTLVPYGSGSISQAEDEAQSFENLARDAANLCPRLVRNKLIKGPQTGSCAAQAAALAPEDAKCPNPPPSSCVVCCCWLGAALKKKEGEAPYACEVDGLSPKQCTAYGVSTQSSAGCFSSPCSYADGPPCP